ncbi:GMC oxidoreductase [Streptomyces sp. GbtcB6]|uniref:GMC oxidoreductase n=1 Tax=Streptomyces sp. GbtcB6 TaxID=2824751 RepID=UPI0027E51635|nr:GMC oxidoreductase [Streptomyces sp. GbtcB6]
MSTCRTGTDEHALADPALAVRGVSGLRVVDAAAMPGLVTGAHPRPRDHARRTCRGRNPRARAPLTARCGVIPGLRTAFSCISYLGLIEPSRCVPTLRSCSSPT